MQPLIRRTVLLLVVLMLTVNGHAHTGDTHNSSTDTSMANVIETQVGDYSVWLLLAIIAYQLLLLIMLAVAIRRYRREQRAEKTGTGSPAL